MIYKQKRGDRTRCVATPKHIDNAQKLFVRRV
nr:MAG TPA: hypothetical protein [Caudoviricetes sp.]